jgi:hypothetical protein
MTPEEIAKEIALRFIGQTLDSRPDAELVSSIAQAIRDAYERAAVVAEEPGDWECQGAAERIRALKGSSS